MAQARLIDNSRIRLNEVLLEAIESGVYDSLSIATGYWDLPGMLDLIEPLSRFKSVRLLIGQEPLTGKLQKELKLDLDDPDALFPDSHIAFDLEQIPLKTSRGEELDALRNTAKVLADMLKSGIMEVRIFRSPRLHAKAYIFGTLESSDAIGIIGSSNFTKAGLTSNAELNYLESDPHRVLFQPQNESQEHGHLSWFNSLWEDDEAVPWTGEFTEIVEGSPVGDLTYGPYDVYIKTLMEVFPDELIPAQELSQDISDVLYSFQNRNAGILINKLQKMGVAMLSDSVGLGKTVTAGAVIKHYRNHGAKKIIVISPAGLMQQWRDDLGEHHKLDQNDFMVVSMQNMAQQQDLIDDMAKPWAREVDLFVIDEAHNLRSTTSARYDKVLELLETSPSAPVLLLTATPINNSLMDFANQIQLASRGSISSVPVQYRNNSGDIETIDFFKALERIQSEVTKAEKSGERFDWEKHEGTLRGGLRHYLVRSTRQGVEAEGGLKKNDGETRHFPKTRVEQLSYTYDSATIDLVSTEIKTAINEVFEGIDPTKLNLSAASEITQRTLHPLDLFAPAYVKEPCPDDWHMDVETYSRLFFEDEVKSIIPNVFQVINFLGFAPYRPDLYRHCYRGKTQAQFRDLGLKGEERSKIGVQRTVHNILHVTWLKRLESSAAALAKSVEYYSERLDLFEKYLKRGYIVTLADAIYLESEYGDDIERAFFDYEQSMREIREALDKGDDAAALNLKGVERKVADAGVFDLDALTKDLARDKAVLKVLRKTVGTFQGAESNGKVRSFAEKIKKVINCEKHGGKVLVFSFFADTVEYLKEVLPDIMADVPEFEDRSEYLSGSGVSRMKDVTRRFAPMAKNYSLKAGEREIDFLFATDVLSEGQNLQDAGFLVNYDLHWNPVRMIQRNGRINRLGSRYEEVLVVNMKPHDDLELYLNLVRRLERKIDTIRNSIGTDQSILGEDEAPKEFADFFSEDTDVASSAASALEEDSGALRVLDSSDDFSLELRKFLADHENDGEIDRVKAIPMGKWNYLPERSINIFSENASADAQRALFKKGSILSLERIEGVGVVSGKPFETTMFIQVDTDSHRYVSRPVDELEALAAIRTSEGDNERAPDRISSQVDRCKVARRSAKQARVKAESTDAPRDLKPKELQALAAIQPYHPDSIDIQGLAKNCLRKAQDEREFRRIVRLINTDLREDGVIKASTNNRFIALFNKLKENELETQRAESIEGVLYYVNRY